MLKISADLELPLDAVTQAIGILARRGAGKTYTASVLVEEVVGAHLPVVVLDPTGAWWGLRSSADGEKAGLPVVIFGGEHGDVPLEATAGKVIADVVIEHPGAYVIDLSGLESKAAEHRFAADFLERLYRAKATHRDPLLVVVDEADGFAPQRPGPEQTRTLGALEAIVRRGRIRGLGVVLVTQRAAVLNKNVLTQIEVLVAMQTTGPQDRAAIDDWIKGNGSDDERAAVMGSLASLEQGEAWVWSPSWLRTLIRIHIRTRRTFDSSRTPEAGQQRVEPRAFAPVDLEQLGERIRATAQTAKANDPGELKKRIRDLEAAATARANIPEIIPEPVIERFEVPVLNGQVDKLLQGIEQLNIFGQSLSILAVSIRDAIDRVQATPREQAERPHYRSPRPAAATATLARPEPSQTPATPISDGELALTKAARLILSALASYPGRTRTQTQVAILTGYSVNGGGFRNALGRLRTLGLIAGGKSDLALTEGGRAATAGTEPLPTGRQLLDHWLGQLSKAGRLVLEALAGAYPASMTQEDVAAATGYESTGGGFRNALGKLRTLELIAGGRDGLRASDDLVDA